MVFFIHLGASSCAIRYQPSFVKKEFSFSSFIESASPVKSVKVKSVDRIERRRELEREIVRDI